MLPLTLEVDHMTCYKSQWFKTSIYITQIIGLSFHLFTVRNLFP
jgi:hypothetical protein